MAVDQETRRRLLELVYDLLSDEEAAELRRRIESDPEIARAHQEAVATSELFSEAARLELPKISLNRPAPVKDLVQAAPPDAAPPWARGAGWAVASAAAILMIVSMSGWLYHRSQMADIAAGHLRLRVTGPAELQAGAENEYLVSTASITGKPVETKVRFALFAPDGELLKGHSEQTDDAGHLRITVPADLALAQQVRLEVTAGDESSPERVDTRLLVRPVRYATYLSLDKPLYQPGETIHYRSLTLSRFDRHGDRELSIAFEIRDPSGATVPGSKLQGVTTRSVGCGSFDIPPALADGRYSLVAGSPDGRFPDRHRTFLIHRYRPPQLKQELEFVRHSYAPGDTVLADVSVQRSDGSPAPDASLHILATVDGKLLYEGSGRASDHGTYRVEFTLPDEIGPGQSQLLVAADDGNTPETIAETIPINLNQIDVTFCPEGGELAAGMANRVYFSARDSTGRPVEISGTVLNSLGQPAAQAETTYQGMGVFSLGPRAGGQYRLRIDDPPGVEIEPKLPDISPSARIVLDAGVAVFDAGTPLEFNLRANTEGVPLVASAWCRGVPVGQKTLITRANANPVSIPVGDDVAGVIRLTAHDYSGNPPEPIAERLVYRRPNKRLHVDIGPAGRFSPGAPVSLSVAVTDESGQPTPAVLGARVLDESLLRLTGDSGPDMSTYFLLTSELPDPEDLENTDFYLSEDERGPATLDLFLGTQGWRRFVDKTLDELRNEGRDEEQLARLIAIGSEAAPPAMFDNLQDLQSRYKTSLVEYRSNRSRVLSTLTAVIFFGSLGLVLLVTMLSLLGIASDTRLWGPAVGVAMASLIIGLVVMNPEGRGPAGLGDVAFAPFDMAPPPPGHAESSTASEDIEAFEMEVQEEPSEKETTPDEPDEMARKGAPPPAAKPAAERASDNKPGRMAKTAAPAGPAPTTPTAKKSASAPKDAPDADAPAARQTFAARGAAQLDTMNLRQDEETSAYGANQPMPQTFGRPIDGDVVPQLQAFVDQAAEKEEDFRSLKVRQYSHRRRPAPSGDRTDFRQALYWNPLLLTDADGRAKIEFDLSDSITTFRASVDGHTTVGRIGSVSHAVVSRIPFSIEAKMPALVDSGDSVGLLLEIANDSAEEIPLELTWDLGELVRLEGKPQSTLKVKPNGREQLYFPLEVVGQKGKCDLTFHGETGPLVDTLQRSLTVVPPGFPQTKAYSGRIDGEEEVVVKLPDDSVPGSLEVSLNVFPSLPAEALQGLQSILQAPHGNCEQASATIYPSVAILEDMRENGIADPALTRRAKDLLADGCEQLIAYECRNGGYEWFGQDPGHEALTALALMEFRRMADVYDVDLRMIERTSQWLFDRRSETGGFERDPAALDTLDSPGPEITDAYITWTLSQSDQDDIEAQVRHVVESAGESKDPYLLALAGAAAVNAGRRGDGSEILARLASLQTSDGHLTGTNCSITHSRGRSLTIETTALAALAWMKLPEYASQADRAVEWIVHNRQGSGGFGSPQATVVALRALCEHSKANRRSVSDGTLTVKREADLLGEITFLAGRHQTLVIDGLEGKLTPGDNRLLIGLTGDNRLPYTLNVAYCTTQPRDHENCPLRPVTKLAKPTVPQGESVTLVATVTNATDDAQPMTVAVLGLPAGLQVRHDQLEELKTTRLIDHYETRPREVICYWRTLPPRKTVELNLELIATLPGKYAGPPSRVYLYNTPAQNSWAKPVAIEIGRQ